jgi:hypothetical protein
MQKQESSKQESVAYCGVRLRPADTGTKEERELNKWQAIVEIGGEVLILLALLVEKKYKC